MKIAMKDVLALIVTVAVWGTIAVQSVMGTTVDADLWKVGAVIGFYVFGRAQEGNLPEVTLGKPKE